MAKFKVLEIVTGVRYQTSEHVACIAVTNVYQSTGLAKGIQDRIVEARGQQHNELRHLPVLQDLIIREGAPKSSSSLVVAPDNRLRLHQFSWPL